MFHCVSTAFVALYVKCKIKVLEFDKKKSENKEILELGLELGSF